MDLEGLINQPPDPVLSATSLPTPKTAFFGCEYSGYIQPGGINSVIASPTMEVIQEGMDLSPPPTQCLYLKPRNHFRIYDKVVNRNRVPATNF
jgi:hypothetical protein